MKRAELGRETKEYLNVLSVMGCSEEIYELAKRSILAQDTPGVEEYSSSPNPNHRE